MPEGIGPGAPLGRRRLACALAGGTALFFALGAWRYAHWHASVNDLGIYLHALWLISHGHLLARNSLLPGNLPTLGDTFSLVWYPLAPLVRHLGGVWFLLALQAACLAAFAGLIAVLAARRTGSERLGWLFGLLAFTSATVWDLALFDVHPDAMALPLLAILLLWEAEHGRRVGWALAAVALLLFKDELALVLALYGVALLLRRRHRRGAMALVLGGAWLFAVEGILIPRLTGGLDIHLAAYAAYGTSMTQVALTVLAHPWVVLEAAVRHPRYLLLLLGPVAFAPVLRPVRSLPGIGIAVMNLLSSFHAQTNVLSQYSAFCLPFFYAAMIDAVPLYRRMAARLGREAVTGYLVLAAGGALGVALVFRLLPVLPVTGSMALSQAQTLIPARAPLVTQDSLLVQSLADRPVILTWSALLGGQLPRRGPVYYLYAPRVRDIRVEPRSAMRAFVAAGDRQGRLRTLYRHDGVMLLVSRSAPRPGWFEATGAGPRR